MNTDKRKAEVEEIVRALRRAVEGLEAIETTEAPPKGEYDEDYISIEYAAGAARHALYLMVKVFDIPEEA